jgi:single-stranded-DNA-specific exonuclease
MLMNASHVCGVERSILGQPWRWRGEAADVTDAGFQPDDLVDQLLLPAASSARNWRGTASRRSAGFMPDPSIFRDMEAAANRLADAVEAGEASPSSATMTWTARPRRPC